MLPCALTEGCTLADGHEGQCDGIIENKTNFFTTAPATLSVTFSNNSGTSLDDNSMKKAVEEALSALSDSIVDTTNVTTLQLTGDASEITGYNWNYLLSLYGNSDWNSLTTLDLSGMSNLTKVENGQDYQVVSSRLTTVSFPIGLQTIGNAAFSECSGLESVKLPENLQTIGTSAFSYASSLTSVDFSSCSRLTTIAEKAFYGCGGLKTVSLPASLQTIGISAFSYCKGLTSVDLSSCSYLITIAEKAFSVCRALETVNFPNGLQTIGNSAFSDCIGLNNVSFPTGLQTIGNSAFSACKGLTSVDLSKCSYLVTIADRAFSGCSSLDTVNFPASLQIIGDSAFSTCSALTAFSVANDNQSFASEDGVLYDKTMKTLVQYPIAKSDESFVIPDTVQTIGEWAFAYSRNLKSVSLPIKLQTIENFAFVVCSKLTTITFQGGKPPVSIAYNAFQNIAGKGIIKYPDGAVGTYTNEWKNAIIGFSQWELATESDLFVAVKDIKMTNDAVMNKDTDFVLTATVEPDTATNQTIIWAIEEPNNIGATITNGNILRAAAAGSVNIKALIEHGSSSTDTYVASFSIHVVDPHPPLEVTFKNSGSDEDMKTAIEAALTNLPPGVKDKAALSAIKLTGDATEITGSNWRYLMRLYAKNSEWTSLTTIDLSGMTNLETVGEVNDSWLFPKLTTVYFPASLKTIGTGAFSFCENLQKADLSACTGLQTIGRDAFIRCGSIQEMNLSTCTSLQTIGSSAFSYNGGLNNVRLPATLQTIDTSAFWGCSNLTSVDLSACSSLTTIARSTFYECKNLNSVRFPANLQTIDNYVFFNCSRLNSLTFLGSASPPSIFDSAFSGVPVKGTIYYPAGAGSVYTNSWKSYVSGLGQWQLSEQSTAFIPVTNITMTNAATVKAETDLSLSATVLPTNATNKTITWSVKEHNGTGAKITGSTFRATAAGTVTIEATIANGTAQGNDYTKTFEITVTDPITTLSVVFDDNKNGGIYPTVNEMKTAVEEAFARSGANKGSITTLQLTGSAKEITSYNWNYLLDLYRSSDWTSLTTMDLSGMNQLTKVENRQNYQVASSRLTTVHLPASLQTIGNFAFYSCGGLTDVSFPDGLTTIGYGAFASCTGLKQLSFPAKLQTIGRSAFSSCIGLKQLSFPASLQTMEDAAFSNCYNLTSVDLSACASLQTIEDLTFNECRSLKSVSFPANLQTIGMMAFSSCASLISMTFLGETPPHLDSDAFSGTAASLPETGILYHPQTAAAAYAKEAFGSPWLDQWTRSSEHFVPVTDITMTNAATIAMDTDLPLTATVTPEDATNQTITWSVEEANGTKAVIEGSTFKASAAGTATIKASITDGTAQGAAYTETFKITVQDLTPAIVPVTDITMTNAATIAMDTDLPLTATVTPEDATNQTIMWSVTEPNGTGAVIEGSTFKATSAGTATIEASIANGTGKGESFTKTFTITVKDFVSVTDITMINAAIVATDTDLPLAATVTPEDATNQTITWSVTEPNGTGAVIKDNTFKAAATGTATIKATIANGKAKGESFTKTFTITVKDPITTLSVAFDDNKNRSLYQNVNDLKTAVEKALADSGTNKANITAIEITGTATEITDYNWSYLLDLYKSNGDWINLTTMDLSNMSALTKVGDQFGNFANSFNLTTISFPDGLETIGAYAFSNCNSLTSVSLPDSLKTIEAYAFSYCSNLENVNLPAGLQTIGNSAFGSCGLTSVSLPASLKTIGAYAFYSCRSLTAFSVDSDNQTFASEDGVLYDKGKETLLQYPIANSATSFALPNTVQNIAAHAFSDCDSLTSVSFPDGLQTIGDYAFYNCNSLTSVSLPEGLESVAVRAFSHCDNLQRVSFPASLQTIENEAFNYSDKLTSMTFLSETPPTFGMRFISNSLGGSGQCTLYYPANAAAAYTSRPLAPELNDWALKPQTATPVASPAGGAYSTAQTVTLTSATNGATIYYTLDGSDPATSGTKQTYTAPFTVPLDTTLKAYSTMGGYTDSTVLTEVYTRAAMNQTATPVAAPAGGAYSTAQTVTLTSATNGATIYYTLDGSDPATSGTRQTYSAPFIVPLGTTLKAYSTMGGYTDSTVLTEVYTSTVMNQTATPVASPAGGAYSTAQTVTLTSATNGATIYYTLGGSDPATSGTRQAYSAPFTVPLGTTLKAYSTMGGYTDSTVLTEVYTRKTSDDGSSSGEGSTYSIYKPQSRYIATGETISQNISISSLKSLAVSGHSQTLGSDAASMIFDPTALEAILAAVPKAADSITFAASPADLRAFPDAAQLIGARPVYNFTLSYEDGNGNLITVPANFPAGSAAIALNYTPADGEVAKGLLMVYVDGEGAVTWLDNSSYDDGRVLADVPHFSTYGVAYKAPAPVFTDITNHWAKADIEFVAAHGLLFGTGNNLFSPDSTMMRGMYVTALGRLAGIDANSYNTGQFTDVKADAYYAPYANWAADKGITSGTTATTFSPDKTVTRQEMAVFMSNYAKAMGYTVPKTHEAVTFTDSADIGSWAADSVKAMQMAGVLNGKDGNRFDPTGTATRAEVSAVLRRYVELVIDPATAQGLDVNDNGKIVYYENGQLFTGAKTIDGTTYHFDSDGICTKIDAVVPDTKKYVMHEIIYGETLWDIARKNNCTVAEIVGLNGIKDPNNVPIGTKFKIPQK